MKFQVLPKRVYGHDDAGMGVGQLERGAHPLDQAFMGQTAEFLEQVAIEVEVRPEHLGDPQRKVPVRDGKENRLSEQRAE